MNAVLLDSGVIVALLDRGERRHAECVEASESLHGPLVTCEPVIAEACYLTRRSSGARMPSSRMSGPACSRSPSELYREAAAVQRILRKYRDREIDLADACLIQPATQLGAGWILTLDSDFRSCRWAGNRQFESLLAWA